MLIKIFPQVINDDGSFHSGFLPTEQGKKLPNLINEVIKNLQKGNITYEEYKQGLVQIIHDTGLVPSEGQFTIKVKTLRYYIKRTFPFLRDDEIKEEGNAILVNIPEELIKYVDYYFNYQKVN